MQGRVLIAYASKYGATAEVAATIGDVLSRAGAKVDVAPARGIRDVRQYELVILGTSIRMEKPLKEATSFARKFRADLNAVPVALFSLGIQMREDTPDNREKAKRFLAPLLALLPEPMSLALFGGKVDHSRLEFFMRFFASRDKSGLMREGDWRNGEEIRKWADTLTARKG